MHIMEKNYINPGAVCDAGKKVEDVKRYPGVSVNCTDHNTVDPKLVEERTKNINNNPRNNER